MFAQSQPYPLKDILEVLAFKNASERHFARQFIAAELSACELAIGQNADQNAVADWIVSKPTPEEASAWGINDVEWTVARNRAFELLTMPERNMAYFEKFWTSREHGLNLIHGLARGASTCHLFESFEGRLVDVGTTERVTAARARREARSQAA